MRAVSRSTSILKALLLVVITNSAAWSAAQDAARPHVDDTSAPFVQGEEAEGGPAGAGFIGGFKFRDDNCNGQLDTGEPLLPGWTFVLTNDETGEYYTAISTGSGFSFSNIPFGTYSLVEVPQPGFKPPCQATTVTVDANHVDIRVGGFGNCPCPATNIEHWLASDSPEWQVVSTPATLAGPLPRPANAIPPAGGWSPGDWISASPTGNISLPPGEYVYRRCFCIEEMFSSVNVSLCIMGDETPVVRVNGFPVGVAAPPSGPCTTIVVTDQTLFRPGQNCVEVVVENSGGPSGIAIDNNSWVMVNNGACCWQPCPCVTPPGDMKGWWPFDVLNSPFFGAGDTKDIAGANNKAHMADFWGLPITAVVPAVGMVGSALRFSGLGDYMQVLPGSEIDLANRSFSVDAWIKIDPSVSGSQPILSKGYTPGFTLFVDNAGDLSCAYSTNGFGFFLVTQPANLRDGRWHHVALVNKLDAGPFVGLTTYVDGVAQDQGFPFALPPSVDAQPFLIGASELSNVPHFMNGWIDEVELFDRALTAAEVYSLWRAGNSGKCQESCFVPHARAFCENASAVVVPVEICNYTATAKIYSLAAAGGGITNACNVSPAGAVFTFLPPTITVNPGECVVADLNITRPTALTFPGATACYGVTATSNLGKLLACQGMIVDASNICVVPTNTHDPNSPLGFIVQDTGAADGVLGYQVVAIDQSTGLLSQRVGLDGNPPGVILEGELPLSPGVEVLLPVSVTEVRPTPFEVYEVRLLADLDGNGEFEPVATFGLRSDYTPSLPGDLNGDCVVNQSDLGLLLSAFGQGPGGDLDGDGDTDQSDLGVLLGAWGTTCP